MWGLTENRPVASKDHNDCSGCSLCLLVCPVWRRTRDVAMTPHGRAKALQNGAGVAELATSIDSCTLCMACEPVCPENIGLTSMLLDLRREQALPQVHLEARMHAAAQRESTKPASSGTLFVPDATLRDRVDLISGVANLLGMGDSSNLSDDVGADIALALEAGVAIPAARLDSFLGPLRQRKKIVVGDGLLLRHLRVWLPAVAVVSVGEALSRLVPVRQGLRPSDLYVIESRAYHSDHDRLVKYYADLRAVSGCAFNLDLQRIAIPATARGLSKRFANASVDEDMQQSRWLLQGRKIERIVVENLGDGIALERVTNTPVVYLASVAEAVR